jgi:lipopolysaccharide transport system ATP-binding protein
MSEFAVEARGLSKSYRVIVGSRGIRRYQYRTIQETLIDLAKRPFRRGSAARSTFWALDDVSFSVRHGEALGIIGPNGAGKSTLLKVLSRITLPTRGTADIYGRVGSLLEVGTGFHAELTGRENIFLNGAILGMSRSQIRRRFDDIVAFADIGPFLDTPVKRYSSGMYMRLAFAVAAHLEPEILIVDEVLAVGDAAFQAKSLGKMSEAAHSGRTVLFVSHNMAAVTQLCQNALLLQHGKVAAYGAAADVVGQYLASGNKEGQVDLDALREGRQPPVRFTRAALLNSAGQVCQSFPMGSDVTVAFDIARVDPSMRVRLAMAIRTLDGLPITHTVDDDASFVLPTGSLEESVRVEIPDLRFYPGTYRITLEVVDWANTMVYDRAENCLTFEITDGGKYTFRWLPRYHGVIFLTPKWSSVSRRSSDVGRGGRGSRSRA